VGIAKKYNHYINTIRYKEMFKIFGRKVWETNAESDTSI
jgi:hypothetical protein